MKNAYGEFRKSLAVDGDKLDVFLGPKPKSPWVFVVHQVVPSTGDYDEDKVMLGFESHENAVKAYLAHYDDPRFLGSVTTVHIDRFKAWLKDEKKSKGKPAQVDVTWKPKTKKARVPPKSAFKELSAKTAEASNLSSHPHNSTKKADKMAYTVDPTHSTSTIIAHLVHDLVCSESSARAAALLADAPEDVDVIAAAHNITQAVHDNDLEKAASLVDEVRAAAKVAVEEKEVAEATINIQTLDVKPYKIDPTVGEMMPYDSMPPDAGSSYGMEGGEVKALASALGEHASVIAAWVSDVPKTEDGKFDPTGEFSIFAHSAGTGETVTASLEEVKTHIRANNTIRLALVATPAEVDQVSAGSVAMVGFDADGDDPAWCVFANGTPVASIRFSDQGHSHRKTFASWEGFGQHVVANIVKHGVKKVLGELNARWYCHSYRDSTVLAEVQARVASVAEAHIADQVAGVAAGLQDRMLLAHAMYTKNMIEGQNPLKFAIESVLRTANVPESNLDYYVESIAGFCIAGVDEDGGEVAVSAVRMYLDKLIAQAAVYAEKSEDTLVDLARMAKVAPLSVSGHAPKTLQERLAEASEVAMVVASAHTDEVGRLHDVVREHAPLGIGGTNRFR